MPPIRPTGEQLLETMAAFQPACILGAAAELDLFTVLGGQSLSADEVAERLRADRRAVPMLLDGLAALGVLDKRDDRYTVPAELRPLLTLTADETVLPMLQHRMSMMRQWTQLAWTVRSGVPGPRTASIRGAAADRAAFIAAMHTYSGRVADEVVARFGPPKFTHLLDVGGASGTWTMALLRAMPGARATLFDLPDAIKQAESRLSRTEFAQRVALVAGDFYENDLPAGADLAWLGAIVHQHSREHNRRLFAKVHAALVPGGRIAIRDIVMDATRTRPLAGALFAINMLVGTDTGGTFTFEELAEDLKAAGFLRPELTVRDDDMNSIVTAVR
jgi:precorrin-6B methylase 2